MVINLEGWDEVKREGVKRDDMCMYIADSLGWYSRN